MKQYLTKKNIKILIITTLILIISLLLFIKPKEHVEIISNIETKEEIVVKEERSTYRLDVKGAVANPGVYELEEGNRVIDAINLAGGLKENADTSVINLSKIITDEMVVIIYTKEELELWGEKKKEITITEKVSSIECPVCPDQTMNDACVDRSTITPTLDGEVLNEGNGTDQTTTNEMGESVLESNSNLLSINTATLEQLDSLPGIGVSKAQAIMDYRKTNGPFQKIDDLLKVAGIGESIFDQIKNLITV